MSSKSRVLLVEDEPAVVASLRRRLNYEGYQVETAVTGQMGLELFAESPPDIVILDVMLPELDGFQVLQKLRLSSALPVLMLTARDAVEDRVRGLELGADDYLVKPFAVEELLARMKALLRRSQRVEETSAAENECLVFQNLVLDLKTRQVRVDSQLVALTPREWELLEYFLRHPRRALTREQIFSAVWGYEHEGSSNVIDVYVRSLREKLKAQDTAAGGWLQTVRGVGYILTE